MGMMDDAQDKFGGAAGMKERYDELCRMEDAGTLDDRGREELQELRKHFEK